VGFFSKNNSKPTKSGSYSFAWPAASGLGQKPYSEEAQAQKDYLVYSSTRRVTEGWESEDLVDMNDAVAVFVQMKLKEGFTVVTGPVDLRALEESPGSEFSGRAAITERSTILWWQGRKGYADQYAILPHQNLQPKIENSFGYHFIWSEGALGDFPMDWTLQRQGPLGFAITPHFSSDGHANRRGASIQATLQHVRGDV